MGLSQQEKAEKNKIVRQVIGKGPFYSEKRNLFCVLVWMELEVHLLPAGFLSNYFLTSLKEIKSLDFPATQV